MHASAPTARDLGSARLATEDPYYVSLRCRHAALGAASMGRAFHMGRLGPFATRVALAGQDVRPASGPASRFVVRWVPEPRPCREVMGLGLMPAADSGRSRPTEFAVRPDAAPSGGPDKAVGPGHWTDFGPRPGGRVRPAAAADFARGRAGPGRGRMGVDKPGRRKQFCPRPLRFQGDRRRANRQVATATNGVG